MPESEDVADYFTDVTLFKVSKEILAPFAPAQKAMIEATSQLSRQFFLYYGNGKSAARISAGLQPIGVHKFGRLPGGGEAKSLLSRDSFILHYPCCGFEHFWSKYVTLGRFPDRFWERPAVILGEDVFPLSPTEIVKCQGSFHLEARDIVAQNDRDLARQFFRERVAIRDLEQIRALLQCGVLARITDPRDLILHITRQHRIADACRLGRG